MTTDDDDLADQLRVLRNYGSRRKYHNELKGFNSRLYELQAAFLREKLSVLDQWNACRASAVSKYRELLADVDVRVVSAALSAYAVDHGRGCV